MDSFTRANRSEIVQRTMLMDIIEARGSIYKGDTNNEIHHHWRTAALNGGLVDRRFDNLARILIDDLVNDFTDFSLVNFVIRMTNSTDDDIPFIFHFDVLSEENTNVRRNVDSIDLSLPSIMLNVAPDDHLLELLQVDDDNEYTFFSQPPASPTGSIITIDSTSATSGSLEHYDDSSSFATVPQGFTPARSSTPLVNEESMFSTGLNDSNINAFLIPYALSRQRAIMLRGGFGPMWNMF